MGEETTSYHLIVGMMFLGVGVAYLIVAAIWLWRRQRAEDAKDTRWLDGYAATVGIKRLPRETNNALRARLYRRLGAHASYRLFVKD